MKLDDAAVLAAKWLGAGMALTSSVLYVQKDAADRGRLGASTFKLLNLAMSVAALVQGCWLFWLVHHQQAAAALVPPALQGALFALLAASVAYCDYQYLVAKK